MAAVSVLLVDDNPMVLKLLEQAVSAFATVSTASDGADALLRAIDAPPDLVVADYSLPGMTGRQFMEKLRGRVATSRIPIVVIATRNDINEGLRPIQEQLEDTIEKPFFVKEAARRIKRIVDKIVLEKMAREAPGESVLRGSLAQMNVLDLLQSLDLGHKTCLLTLSNSGERCELFFNEGQINHAINRTVKGDDAVYKVMNWTGGNFEIDFSKSSAEQTTTRSTQGLLMEGLRQLDEANRDSENVLEA